MVGARRIVVLTIHVAKDGSPKIVDDCTLPLTAAGVVNRIITDLATIDVSRDGLQPGARAPGVTEEEVRVKTSGPLHLSVKACRDPPTQIVKADCLRFRPDCA